MLISRSRASVTRVAAVFAASSLLLLGGCATSPNSEPGLTVTESQYRTAFDKFAECMADAGFELVRVDDSDAVIDFSYSEEAARTGADMQCYADFEPIDIAWQLQNSYDDPSSKQVRDCLTDAGLTPEGTVEGEFRQLVEAGLDEECLSQPPE